MIAHPTQRDNYGELKERLARQFPYDIESYINGKNHLVGEIQQKALKWKERNQKEL